MIERCGRTLADERDGHRVGADAVAFGTWARAVPGLDNIVREQWENVWP